MRTLLATAVSGIVLLTAAGAHAAAAMPTYASVDEVRVIPQSGAFSIFWRENMTRVHNGEIDTATGNVSTLIPCAGGALAQVGTNELGYDVVAHEDSYDIVFSSVALGTLHRGTSSAKKACTGAPDPTFQTPAPRVRLSQTEPKDAPRSMAFFATTPSGLAAFVDMERTDGTHTTIATRIAKSVPAYANPSFVSGKTALLLVPTDAGLLAQTFDTELGVAIDEAPKTIAEGVAGRAIGYPDETDGGFRIIYAMGASIFEGHLKDGAFESKPLIVGDASLFLSDVAFEGPDKALAIVAEKRVPATNPSLVFVRPRFVAGEVQPLRASDQLDLRLPLTGNGAATVACRNDTCVVARPGPYGRIELRRVRGNTVDELSPLIATTTFGGGRGGPNGGTPGTTSDVPLRDTSASSGSGCTMQGRAPSGLACVAMPFALFLCALRCVRRRRA